MVPLDRFILLLAVVLACLAAGVGLAWWRDTRARGAEARLRRGRGLTAPVLVAVAGRGRRVRAVVDGGDLDVIGPRTRLHVPGRAYLGAAQRRHHLDEELLEFATQRGFVDAAGTAYLVGALEDWEPALTTALVAPPRPASRGRRVAAAVPREPLVVLVLGVLGLLAFQGVWAAGHDVVATTVRVVGDEGLESCAVRWSEDGRPGYAEVDCYAPFPAAGEPLRIRALGTPFTGAAMDLDGTYEALTLIPGGAALLAGVVCATATVVRLRRPAVRLDARTAEPPALSRPDPVAVSAHAPLGELLDALGRVEGWSDGVTPAPPQPWWQPWAIALTSARWWPVPVLAGVAVAVAELPDALRTALGVAAVGLALWAAARAARTWRTIRPAYTAPVTSEWDYRLVRLVDDEWLALLLLGVRPHWLLPLVGPGHPPVTGRCGVRGDLSDGGAVQLRVGDGFWMCGGQVVRVDDEVLHELRDELVDRLVDLGRSPDLPGTSAPG